MQATRALDNALKTLNDGIKAHEEMLTSSLEQKAGIGSLNTEIRDHCEKLNSDKREAFLKDALDTLRRSRGAAKRGVMIVPRMLSIEEFDAVAFAMQMQLMAEARDEAHGVGR